MEARAPDIQLTPHRHLRVGGRTPKRQKLLLGTDVCLNHNTLELLRDMAFGPCP